MVGPALWLGGLLTLPSIMGLVEIIARIMGLAQILARILGLWHRGNSQRTHFREQNKPLDSSSFRDDENI